MDSVQAKKVKVLYELGCHGLDCVELLQRGEGLEFSWSGTWYAHATRSDNRHIEVHAGSPDAAMDLLIAQVQSRA